jgi:hypothetical protein
MPNPEKNEKRPDYISRCVQMLKHEDPKRPTKECLGQCYGMWDEHKKKKVKE